MAHEQEAALDAQGNADLAIEKSQQVWDIQSQFPPVVFQMVARHC